MPKKWKGLIISLPICLLSFPQRWVVFFFTNIIPTLLMTYEEKTHENQSPLWNKLVLISGTNCLEYFSTSFYSLKVLLITWHCVYSDFHSNTLSLVLKILSLIEMWLCLFLKPTSSCLDLISSVSFIPLFCTAHHLQCITFPVSKVAVTFTGEHFARSEKVKHSSACNGAYCPIYTCAYAWCVLSYNTVPLNQTVDTPSDVRILL